MAALATTQHDDEVGPQEEEPSSVQPPSPSDPVLSDGVDPRMERQKAAQFLRETETYRRQVEKLERDLTLTLQCRKNGWTGELQEYEKRLEEERNAEKMNLQMQLRKIHNGVRRFQSHLTDVKPTPELIEKLKEIMSEVEISINAFKEEQQSCFEEFMKEERTCRQEISAYEKKIENWSLAAKPVPKVSTVPVVKSKLLERDLPAEVKALEAFLQKTGGPHGGWDQFDHQAFLKVWTKHSGQPPYRREAKLFLPGKTAEEIEQHEDWHQELLYLQGRKREAIKRWKDRKDQERLTRIQSQEEKEEAERREEEARSAALQHRIEEERRELSKQMKVWREEKKRKDEQEGERMLAQEIQKRKREKEERRRQLEVKLILEEQLQLKREEKEEEERKRREQEEREREEKRREAAKSIRRFNERDLQKVEVKLHEKQLREKEEEERQKRIATKLKEKMDGHVNRDPSRLTQPTKGWQERMKHIGPSGGGQMLQMFHRAVPTWRQDL